MTFEEFYKEFGLKRYPFNVFTTEDEEEIANSLFIEPLDYALIKDGYMSCRTIMMSGNRGTGKTAIIYDLKRNAPEKSLTCYIDDFSSIPIPPKTQLTNYYQLLCGSLVNEFFSHAHENKKSIQKLEKTDKVFLSFLLYKFATPITKQLLFTKIEEIQLTWLQRTIKKFAGFFRILFNYGLNVAVSVANDLISRHFGILPLIDESKLKDYFPELNFIIDNDFSDTDTNYAFLRRICLLVHKLNYSNIIVFFDKIDEDNRLDNDAEVISEFIKPLLIDNKLLSNNDLQIVVSIWSIPFSMITPSIRTQKYYCPELAWTNDDLIRAFNKRVKVYSNAKPYKWGDFFSSDIEEAEKASILSLANGNPRDLWHILNHLMKAQYKLNSNIRSISFEAAVTGKRTFVETFNYYEYYPQKSNSRKDTMDIYKYIAHLLKLDSEDFTSNQLSTQAQTGSSTANYLIGMQKLGLISRTDEKRSGGYVYRINDPKVTYAIKNGIKIAHKK